MANDKNKQGVSLSFDKSALIDALLVIIVMIAVKRLLLPYSLQFAGPASTLCAMIVATWRLRLRGLTWADLGFRRPESISKTLLLTIGFFAVLVFSIFIGSQIAGQFFVKPDAEVVERFGDLEGNWPLFLMWMGLTWTHAAFFEEMLYRAFLINRIGAFLGEGTVNTLLCVLLPALFFGYRHMYYQGWYGFITAGIFGLLAGFFYIWVGKRNLWPQILGHGVLNSIGFIARFLGVRA